MNDYDEYLEVIDEIKKIDIIKTEGSLLLFSEY